MKMFLRMVLFVKKYYFLKETIIRIYKLNFSSEQKIKVRYFLLSIFELFKNSTHLFSELYLHPKSM